MITKGEYCTKQLKAKYFTNLNFIHMHDASMTNDLLRLLSFYVRCLGIELDFTLPSRSEKYSLKYFSALFFRAQANQLGYFFAQG